MSINDFRSPKLAAIKLLLDELYPLIICNQITICTTDSPLAHIQIYCINPQREVRIKLLDDGKVNIIYNALNYRQIEINYDLADPGCAPRVLRYIIKNDQELFNCYAGGLKLLNNIYTDMCRQIELIIGNE